MSQNVLTPRLSQSVSQSVSRLADAAADAEVSKRRPSLWLLRLVEKRKKIMTALPQAI